MSDFRWPTLWIASGNSSKVRELTDFATKFFPEYGSIKSREPNGVVEDEPTFLGNAKLKSSALARELAGEGHDDFAVLGDDSGLSVDLLGGEPGIRSARYSGPEPTPSKNGERLLRNLEKFSTDLKLRTGKYRCALYLLQISNSKITAEYVAEGDRDGLIGLAPRGANGYAYDGVFLDPQTLLSYGEVSYEEKQKDSHRYRAFAKLSNLAKGVQQ